MTVVTFSVSIQSANDSCKTGDDTEEMVVIVSPLRI